VVIDDLDSLRARLRPSNAEAPLIVDADAVLALAIVDERFQPIARWRSQERKRRSRIQLRELARGDFRNRSEALRFARLVERLRVGAAEAFYHGRVI
jgi:hypothetical protein